MHYCAQETVHCTDYYVHVISLMLLLLFCSVKRKTRVNRDKPRVARAKSKPRALDAGEDTRYPPCHTLIILEFFGVTSRQSSDESFHGHEAIPIHDVRTSSLRDHNFGYSFPKKGNRNTKKYNDFLEQSSRFLGRSQRHQRIPTHQ